MPSNAKQSSTVSQELPWADEIEPGYDVSPDMPEMDIPETSLLDEALSIPVGLPEAPASFNTVLYRPSADKTGYHWVSVTVRGHDPIATFHRFDKLCSLAEDSGWATRDLSRQSATSTPPQQPTGFSTNEPRTNVGASVPPNQPTDNSDEGDDTLHKLVVQVDGTTEFHVGRFKYPFKDSRAPDVISELFAPECKGLAAKLGQIGSYDLEGLGYRVEWQIVRKPSKRDPGSTAKYYNVVRVYKS